MKTIFRRGKLLLLLLWLCSYMACQKNQIRVNTTDDVNIVGYLNNHAADYSLFSRIIERAEASGYLNAYGAYTLFAPTNTAVKTYLSKQGKTSVDDIGVDALKDLLRFHLIADTLTTSSFTDGKLPAITQYGQYLITSVATTDGKSSYLINRQAIVTKANIVTGNGIIHAIDHVLEPAQSTLAQLLSQDSRYSIFTQALKETGYYDSLNIANNSDSTRRWLTLIAQTDAVYRANNIADYPALKALYSQTGNPKLAEDSLHLYVAYHILPGIRFLADIVSATSHSTLAPQEVVTSKLSGQEVLLNEDIFNGITEPGVQLDRTNSDITANNGALHSALSNLSIKVRKPVPVYWDVADQPELRKLVSLFRKPGQVQEFTDPDQFSGINWSGGSIKYNVTATSSSDYYCYYDFISLYMRTAVTPWIEFKTPFLVKGKYKVWVCFRRARAQTIQVQVDDQIMPRLISVADYYPVALDDDNAEAAGFKRFMVTAASNSNHIGKLVGTVDITTSQQHTIKFIALTNESGSANTFNLDMVHFIPIEEEQKWPRFNRDGSMEYK
ncbi:fasciclin domain-containing protein [Filimonas effusa]|uniref:Fasciclin domain-containing protein n=1 Tax=Filimonas effusa TaxID=2508721 RepID=A0A4Q1DCD9_9BACT|nr:fasciclin domain-containing protein [Filimonas effusa]RXK86283.1 fasciclin domain-containing protein [Filimonas effusa]